MSKKVLLLNNDFQVISFVNEKKAIKLLWKNKVDIISSWQDVSFRWINGIINFPAILKLKYYIKKTYKNLVFSRRAIFKRDGNFCQYCSRYLTPGEVTIDHIIPKSLGGISSFQNCITSCLECNRKKANRTPEQAQMATLKEPIAPSGYVFYMSDTDHWHPEWTFFFGKNEKTLPNLTI